MQTLPPFSRRRLFRVISIKVKKNSEEIDLIKLRYNRIFICRKFFYPQKLRKTQRRKIVTAILAEDDTHSKLS